MGPNKGENKENFDKSSKIFQNLLMNHRPECIDIWYGASLGKREMKSLGSCMDPPQGLKLSHSVI